MGTAVHCYCLLLGNFAFEFNHQLQMCSAGFRMAQMAYLQGTEVKFSRDIQISSQPPIAPSATICSSAYKCPHSPDVIAAFKLSYIPIPLGRGQGWENKGRGGGNICKAESFFPRLSVLRKMASKYQPQFSDSTFLVDHLVDSKLLWLCISHS